MKLNLNPNTALVLRLLLSAAFIISAVGKLLSPGLTEIILVEQGIAAGRETAAFIARFLIGSELALGLLLLWKSYQKNLILPLTIITLLGFSIYLIVLIAGGDSEDCGCVGALASMSPVESLIKNIVLISISFILYYSADNRSGKMSRLFATAVLAFALPFTLTPIKSLSDFPFAEYTRFEGAGRVDLSSGENLLAVINLDCEHCQEAASEIAYLHKSGIILPPVFALYFREDTTSVETFNKITGTNFPYNFISAEQFFDLIGSSPPRIYYLKNGGVDVFWDENFLENLQTHFSRTKIDE